MSYKSSQLTPPMATRIARSRSLAHALSQGYALESWKIHPFRSWLAPNPNSDPSTRRSVHWGKTLGLALTVVTGATFWTGVGLLVARLCK